jgi:hypothetical protein
MLRAIAAGVPPLAYQWRKGGVPILSATSTNYSIPNISSGGDYDLVVTNLYGSATSSVSTVTIDRLSIIPDGSDVVISWKYTDATLQEADFVTGPYADVPGAPTSPYTNTPSATPKFYRYSHVVPKAINSNPYNM